MFPACVPVSNYASVAVLSVTSDSQLSDASVPAAKRTEQQTNEHYRDAVDADGECVIVSSS